MLYFSQRHDSSIRPQSDKDTIYCGPFNISFVRYSVYQPPVNRDAGAIQVQPKHNKNRGHLELKQHNLHDPVILQPKGPNQLPTLTAHAPIPQPNNLTPKPQLLTNPERLQILLLKDNPPRHKTRQHSRS